MKPILQLFRVVFLLFLWNILTVNTTFAQKSNLIGKVLDANTLSPLSYASIRVMGNDDDAVKGGNITDDDGAFSIVLETGNYYAVIEYLGYDSLKTEMFSINKERDTLDLGNLKIAPSAQSLEEVTVIAEKSSMEFRLDKRVFNVGKDLANAGGSAIEILSNVPSLSVDLEGNVRLRGSGSVRILIDGKPSGLVSFKGSSGLQQLSGNMIERVEIITNPSARYEAEGMAGIINIVLKKDRNQGFNGSVEVITGYPTNLGLAANLNYRRKRINFFINYGIAYRIQPRVGTLHQESLDSLGNLLLVEQDTEGDFTGFNPSARSGLDFFFSEKSILTAAYTLRRSKGRRLTDNRYEDYFGSLKNLSEITYRTQDESETEPNQEYALTYKRTFEKKGHEMVADLRLLDYWERSDQLFEQETYLPNGEFLENRSLVERSLNDEFEKQWLLQLDYIYPFSKEGKLETGIRGSFREMVNDFIATQELPDGSQVPLPDLDNYFTYNEDILGIYGIIGNKINKFSYQVGLRAEWTDIQTALEETNEVNPRSYGNLFPSMHLTYDLPKENALQWSYSRRVRRPVYNDLSPFVTLSDSRNFFAGNPDLNPEFSDVFELGHIKYFEKGSLSSAIYYRYTDSKIERIRAVKEDGTSETFPQNLNWEQAVGAEFTGAFTLYKWWKLDLNANFFYAQVDGTNLDPLFKTDTYSWFARQTSRFSLPKSIDAQLRANFEAPQKFAQGKRKALYYLDASVSKKVMKNKGTLNLSVLDVFNSRRFRTIIEGENFKTDIDSQFQRRQINLTFNYRINQG